MFTSRSRIVLFALIATLVALAPSQALALGGDYGQEELKGRAGAIGEQTPVHGYWVNWEDVFFYAGDATAFNKFIEAYSQFKHRQLKVVMHRGPKQAASPWKQLDSPADWSLYVWNNGASLISKVEITKTGDEAIEYVPAGPPAPTSVDVWIGGRLELSALRIPASLEVAAAADAANDTEIRRYIAGRPPALAANATESSQHAEKDLLLVTVDLADGSRLRGETAVHDLPLETAFGKLLVPSQQVAAVQVAAEPGTAAVEFRNGDRLSGIVSAAEWGDQHLQTAIGEIAVPVRLIRTYRIEGIKRRPKVTVRASSSWKVSTAERAFDGRSDTDWNSGNYAPAWIEADLASARAIAGVCLIPGQDIAGATTHEIWISDEPIGDDHAQARLIHTFQGETTNAAALRFDFPETVTGRYLQVRTTQSPTWISWWEVEIRTMK